MMGAALKNKARTEWDSGEQSEFLGAVAAAALIDVSPAFIRRAWTEKKLKRYKIGARSVSKRADVIALAILQEK